jgi:hypothetical protein
LPHIEACDLAHTLKWKIAFHYQPQRNPLIPGIFDTKALECYFKTPITMSEVATKLKGQLTYENLFSVADNIWQDWDAHKTIKIWKLSHGVNDISEETNRWLEEHHYVTLHKDTAKSQGKKFADAVQVGDFISLSRSNKLTALVRITSDIESHSDSPLGSDWLLRRYEIIKTILEPKPYSSSMRKGWMPSYNGTLALVYAPELPLFEQEILKPFFNMFISELPIGQRKVASETENYDSHAKVISPVITPRNVIYYGPPGTGKTYKMQNLLQTDYVSDDPQPIHRYSMVTFHQSYGYEEFIEGLRAKTDDKHNITYRVESGAFLKLCEQAEKDPESRYAVMIDEINRGNISKIFGELISLIESDKRKGCKHEMSVTLPYSGSSFSIPRNVDIIGTMNTADRSLALMDIALRRRFEFEEMMPQYELLSGTEVAGVDLAELLKTMNQRIKYLYDREHCLGHAFLLPVKVAKENDGERTAWECLKSIFKNKIIPLLEEYFYDDWHKIHLVLGDNQKPSELQFVQEKKIEPETLLQNLFGEGHGLEYYGQQRRYMFNEDAFDQERSYTLIVSSTVSVVDEV